MLEFSVSRRLLLAGFSSLALSSSVAAAQSSLELASPELAARARALHDKIIVIDAHADVPDDFGVGAHEAGVDGDGQVDLPKLRRGGVGAVVLAAFVPQGPYAPDRVAAARGVTDRKLETITAVGRQHADQAELALTAADVRRIRASGKVAVLAGFLNAYPFGEDLSAIDAYAARGVRVFGFVHAGNNAFADSSRPQGEPRTPNGGLSPLGKAAVGRLNDLGVLIDVSQLTPAGLEQVLALSRAPVIASHSGVRGRVDVGRNLSDAELKAVADKGGVVSIVAFKTYLTPNPADYDARVRAIRARFGLAPDYKSPTEGAGALPADKSAALAAEIGAIRPPVTVVDLVDSIDYAVKRIGIDHVGVASDFNHGGGVIGWANEAEAPNVTAELLKRGYSESDIAKLWGGNFLRVLSASESAARRVG